MRFPYKIRQDLRHPDDPSFTIVDPFIPIELTGTGGEIQFDALVDTGSHLTIFPKCHLIEKQKNQKTYEVRGVGGERVEITRSKEITMKLMLDAVTYVWPYDIWFAQTEDYTPTLGHKGFLEFFTATFDGKSNQLTLESNEDFPGQKVDMWNGK